MSGCRSWREFRIGAWLHDCGKVTTPECVVDKATKLETNVNRIHEVRIRFEVLQRQYDATVAQLHDAIADIFEALTAADRPYKQGKPLSECIDMLAGFRDRHHIDPDLFALFLRSGVYRTYAEVFLRPEQIDAVDIEKYLKPVGVQPCR